MPEEPDTITREIPEHLMANLEVASKDLALRQSAHLTAKSRAKDAKDMLEDATNAFIVAGNALVPLDGFPEDTPMAEQTGDTPPDEQGDLSLVGVPDEPGAPEPEPIAEEF